MKQVIALLTLLSISIITHSQEKLAIKQGNTVHYSVTVEGSTFPMFAWIDSLDDANYILTWSFENGRSGRFIVTKPSLDNARMGHWDRPIPGALRNVAITAPYMHDGMLKTLDDVIEFYNHTEKVVPHPINKDTILAKPLDLTPQEKNDLKEFLISLTDKRFKNPE